MDLIIVESPTKAKTLSRFLGDNYRIEASMGHIRDLPERKLGVDVEHNFKPDYEVSAKKADKVKELQGLAAKAKKVILATDPDREGEAISWHIASLLEGKTKASEIERITFHEITESAIQDALKHPGKINMQLVDAQQARRILDRLVGYKLSPVLWRKIRKGLSAGRVQSVAVRLIVDREREIIAFKPVEYWDLIADLKNANGEFQAKLSKTEINNKEEVDKIILDLEKADYQVSDVSKKEVRRNPYPPFTTSTLQQAASNLMGWSAKRTMQVAQNLYEQGLITYHRTDSTNLATEALSMVRGYIHNVFGDKYLPAEAKLFKTKSKVAQEAHEAIRPTSVDKTEIPGLDRDQARLYELIWKRFVACQMTEAVYEQLGVDIKANAYTFRANGNKQLFDGWKKLYQKVVDENEEQEQTLPELSVGEHLDLIKLSPNQHFTEPPPRYTEASLIKALEEHGIGRPSTYAPIISTIQERQYVEKAEKKLVPTNLGFAVNDFLMTNFKTTFEYEFTAKMENQLDEIANGEKQWVPVIKEFYDPFSEILEKVLETAERVKVEVEATDEICPDDGSPLVVRIGKFGKFLACSKFPDCKFTKPWQNKVGIKCPKCQIGDVILKKTKSKRNFFGCSRYPDCDFASWNKPKVEETPIAPDQAQTPVNV